MNIKRFSTSIITLCFISTLCIAEPNQQSAQKQKAPIILVNPNKGVSSGRPKAPDRQTITCAYDGEQLHLTLVYSEGTATLSVTDETLLTSTYEIDTAPLVVTVPVGELNGTISIELETQRGNSYSGYFE